MTQMKDRRTVLAEQIAIMTMPNPEAVTRLICIMASEVSLWELERITAILKHSMFNTPENKNVKN